MSKDKDLDGQNTAIQESAQLADWKKTPSVRDWAKVRPELGKEDLRPYLFVTKDRKDYFGSVSALGHLATVAERLLATKFEVQAIESDLKQLTESEAAQVFETVRGRIIGTDTFDKEPPGVAGLIVLVKAQPTLQGKLLDFLGSLPSDRLGAWACTGWASAIIDAQSKERLESLLETWSKNGNSVLKLAANSILGTYRKGGH